VIILDGEATRAALPMVDAIASMRVAFSPDTEAPLRSLLGSSLFMPGRVGQVSGVKVVSVVPGNPVGVVAIFDEAGGPLGIVDGTSLTAIRTGAVAGLATDLLAPATASRLAMVGAGAMAYDQVEAVRAVRELDQVLVWSRHRENASILAERVGGRAVGSADEAVAESDIVSCATPATVPLFSDSSVRAGTHINAVGAFLPEMIEVPRETVERAYVVVDDYQAAASEAGDLINADRTANASLSELLAGKHPAIGEDVTLFKSVGIATQDVAAGYAALQNAQHLGLGVHVG
jgi:alanine dehydrogenase